MGVSNTDTVQKKCIFSTLAINDMEYGPILQYE